MAPRPDSRNRLPDETQDIPEISSIVRLLPTCTPLSLDVLARRLQASELARRQSTRKQQCTVFLASEPPGTEVERLQQILPQVPAEYIIRNLMVTKDENKTLESMLAVIEASTRNPDGDKRSIVDPSPPFMGPFPKTMEVSPLYGEQPILCRAAI